MPSPTLSLEILRVLRSTGRAHRTYDLASAFGLHATDEAYASFSAALDALGDQIIRTRGIGASVQAA